MMTRSDLQERASDIVDEFVRDMGTFVTMHLETLDEDGQRNTVWLREIEETATRMADDLKRYIWD